MADFDLDAVEELIAQDKAKVTGEKTKKEYTRKRDNSQDSDRHKRPQRSGDKKKSRRYSDSFDSHSDSEDDRRNRRKHHRDSKSGHRSRAERGGRRQESSESKSNDKGALKDKETDEAAMAKRREEALAKSLEEAKRQAEEAQRDDCTVLVSRIHLNVDEKELFMFFSKANVGKIRDVRLIRD